MMKAAILYGKEHVRIEEIQAADLRPGEVRIRITAPVAGLLAGLRRQPLLCKGDLVARILAL